MELSWKLNQYNKYLLNSKRSHFQDLPDFEVSKKNHPRSVVCISIKFVYPVYIASDQQDCK